MKNTKNKKWFTLVELIIVITILAILATIAFISFQSYTAQSRDAKVKSELGGARNAIEAELAKNSSILLSLASSTWSNVTTLDLGWVTVTKTDSNYKAWDLNTTLLWGVKFDNKYKVWVTNVSGDNYQLAWTLTDGWNRAYVIWNFNPRTDTPVAVPATACDATANTITISDSNIWKFKKDDTVTLAWVTAAAWTPKITSISTDMKTVTLSVDITACNATVASNTIVLAKAESVWLIWDKAGSATDGTAIKDGSTTELPY